MVLFRHILFYIELYQILLFHVFVDNILHFKKWQNYREIIKICDILVFDRPCQERMIDLSTLYGSMHGDLPKITIDRSRLSDISSTDLRKGQKTHDL